MLWVDKHIPRKLEQLDCHPNITGLLKQLSSQGDIPHLLFYGPSGGGKKTRIACLLRELFGDAAAKLKPETINAEGVAQEFLVCSSPFHHQISCSELGNKDRVCTQYLIKQLAGTVSASNLLVREAQPAATFRVFVFQESELLSQEAQAGLRRTLEKYMRFTRVILHCQQLSSIMRPLRSRCLCIRVPAPSEAEVLAVLRRIAKVEMIEPSEDYLREIVIRSRRNLRRAILMLETAALYSFPSHAVLELPWEQACEKLASSIKQLQSPKALLDARETVYDLLCSCIPPSLLLARITEALLTDLTVSNPLRLAIIRAASHYAYTVRMGTKDAWHLEAFIAQCMNAFKIAQHQHQSQQLQAKSTR